MKGIDVKKWLQFLCNILEQAKTMGKALFRKKGRRAFALAPEKISSSPLDVPTINVDITTQEIVDIVREGRES